MESQLEITVAEYLQHHGYYIEDGESINAPYRDDADSESFTVDGPFWYDHSHGEGGNTWQLALRIHSDDRRQAVRSIYEAAGLPLPENEVPEGEHKRIKAEKALAKVRDKFGLTSNSPERVLEYLKKRGITEKCHQLLAWIPEGRLANVLTDEEIELSGLRYREEKLILWYLRDGLPVYYCARGIETKEFRKASTQVLDHPIWNVDALYNDTDIVWSEGFFDVLTLIELGYTPAGEITCNPVKKHQPELLQAVKFRNRKLKNKKFIICLDDDAPTTEGRRPGNEAAEKLAGIVLDSGLDARWVKHREGDSKVDINDLHMKGLDQDIHRMLATAEPVEELITTDSGRRERIIVACLNAGNYALARRIVEKHAAEKGVTGAQELDKLIQNAVTKRRTWCEFYRDDKIDLTTWGEKVLVRYKGAGYKSGCQSMYCKKTDLPDQIRAFQRNRALEIKVSMLDIPARKPTWQVARDVMKDDGQTVNLFRPSPLLLQNPSGVVPDIPETWYTLLKNLAGEKEREWLLNHMAVYVQTLEKPQTIPVLYSGQGTGKNTLAQYFGEAMGSYIAVKKEDIQGSFNDYLQNALILIDELACRQKDVLDMQPLLKQLINGNHRVNAKYVQPEAKDMNNYVMIASNPHPGVVPVLIEKGDRRYSIINGGANKNLSRIKGFEYDRLEVELPQFMQYLLSCGIDKEKARLPLENKAREQIMARSQDPREAAVVEWLQEHKQTDHSETMECVRQGINSMGTRLGILDRDISARDIRQLLEQQGVNCFKNANQWWVKDVAHTIEPAAIKYQPDEEQDEEQAA